MHKGNIEVREILAEETYPVRHSELRKGRPLHECEFQGDSLDSTYHIGGFYEDRLTAIATFLRQDQVKYNFENAYQLRGMAVLKEFHGQGFGKLLLTFGEALLKEHHLVDVLWMNARHNAIGFYEKNGYAVIGDCFEIPPIGMHYVMFKKL